MALTVHLLNWNMGLFSHISIVVEDRTTKAFFKLDTMARAEDARAQIDLASSRYSFDIKENIETVADWWSAQTWHHSYHIIKNNCGDVTQRFLERFACIQAPHRLKAPLSINYFFLGLFIPSFLPIGVTLSGRIMDHAKFYIEARKHPEIANQYSEWVLKLVITVSLLFAVSSFVGIAAAAIYLSTNLVPTATAILLGSASTASFFNTTNMLAKIHYIKSTNRIIDGDVSFSSAMSLI